MPNSWTRREPMSAIVEQFLADLPTRRREAWKYTDLKGIAAVADATGWSIADVDAAPDRRPDTAPVLSELDADLAYIVDGHPLTHAGLEESTDGWRITGGVNRPLHLVFVATANDEESLAAAPAFVIKAEPGSQRTVIESHVTLGRGNSLSMPRLSIEIGRDAQVAHIVLSDEGAEAFHLASTDVTVDTGARFEGFALETGRGLTRRETTVTLLGEHAEVFLGGAYFGLAAAHQDNTTLVVHEAPNARSRQNFRGVLDGDSRGVFQGKVLVQKQAQGTDGQQHHKALLLSPKAEVDAKPELEIYADDVQCAHGATVGAIDADQLFYLMARGISEDDARAILTEAFLMQSLSGISNAAIREAFRNHLATRLGERA